MTFTFVMFLFFAILLIATFFFRRYFKKKLAEIQSANASAENKYDKPYSNNYVTDTQSAFNGAKIAFGIFAFITALFLLLSSIWFVPVRNVGIVTSFNSPTGRTTGSGLKVTWPWEEVQDFDASIQVSDHTSDKNCSNVRIGSLATACAENRIQWQVLEDAAPKLYKDYKGNFDNLRNNLVETKIQNALNTVFATYNPLSQVNIQTGQTSFDGAKLGKDVEAELNRTIGSDIKIVSVSVPLVHHDSKTEDNIKRFQDVIANSRILDQLSSNADKEKAIADKQKVFLTPEYIQNKCVDESVKMGVPPGLCLVGGGAIVNATK